MQYALVRDHWRKSPSIDISITGTESRVSIPVPWLQLSGDNTWTFVVRLLGHLVEESGTLEAEAGKDGVDSAPVESASEPVAGSYTYRALCMSVRRIPIVTAAESEVWKHSFKRYIYSKSWSGG